MNKPKKITTRQALEAAAIVHCWANNNPILTKSSPEYLIKLSSELFECIQAEQCDTEERTKKGWPSKLTLVEIMIDYCNTLPKDFTEEEFHVSPYVQSIGYSHAGASAKSLLGEEWETDDGRRFCFVALCPWDPNEPENWPEKYDYETGQSSLRMQMKNGLDCTGIDFIDDYPEGTPWNEKCWTRVILRAINGPAPCYQSWNREIVNFTRAAKLNGKKIKREFTKFFQLASVASAISDHSKTP